MLVYYLFSLLLLVSFLGSGDCKSKGKPNATITPKPLINQTYKVIKVADGDTITVIDNSNKNVLRIRFLCIDAPEKSQGKWGDLSLKKLTELLPLNTNVTLIGSSTDMYNRTLAQIVNKNGININKKMMELGLVVMYPGQKGCNDFKDIEASAKKVKMGVWSDSKFEMPWDYRKRMGIGFRGHHTSTTTKKSKINSRY